MQPDTAIRSELKQWVFNNVEPCQERTTAFVIRQVSTGRYYAGRLSHIVSEEWTKNGSVWADSLSSHSIRQFSCVTAARAEFHWSLWLGNWFDSFLPRKWRRVIPWRQFEIVEVYNVWEYCDWNTPYPCRHRRTSL